MAPDPPGPRVFSRAIRSTPLRSPFRPLTCIAKYNGETKPELWLADFRLACQLGELEETIELSSGNSSSSSPTPPVDGSRSSPLIRFTTGLIWSESSRVTSKGPT